MPLNGLITAIKKEWTLPQPLPLWRGVGLRNVYKKLRCLQSLPIEGEVGGGLLLLLIYSKFLTSVLQETYNLMSGGDTGIDVGLGGLRTHLLGCREVALRE